MKKKNGFTVIELLSSIVLISIVAIVLIEIVISLKEIYTTSGIKTELLNKQGIISNRINETLISKQVVNVTKCGDMCIKFVYSDLTQDELNIDQDNKMISFGNYKTSLVKDSYFGEIKIDKLLSTFTHPTNNDSILNVKIPIYTLLSNEDYGVNVVFQYNRTNTIIDF